MRRSSAYRRAIRGGLWICLALAMAGCWVARTAHDRPELRANIGRRAILVETHHLCRDRGGRLHLVKDDLPKGYAVVATLAAGSALRIEDVVYRISDPGRRDYYVIRIETAAGFVTMEVPSAERSRPAWRFEG